MQLKQPKYVVKAAKCFHCVDIPRVLRTQKLSNLTAAKF